MLTGGTGTENLVALVSAQEDVEDMLSRVRSMLVFSVENRGAKIDTHSGIKKADVMCERWKAIFSKYDSDGSGTLGVEDIKRMVRRDLKIAPRLVSDKQIVVLFGAIDEDGGGSVEFSEFLEFVQQPSTRGTTTTEDILDAVARGVRLALRRNRIKVENLKEVFTSFDESGDVVGGSGELRANDMIRFFRKALKLTKHECTDKALRVAFQAMDDDGSGSMSMDEFLEFMEFCSMEPGQKGLPDRVPGLIGGMAGHLPHRIPSQRPGSIRHCPLSRLPFCLNGRDIASNGRLASTQAFLPRSDSAPSFPSLTSRTAQALNRQLSGGVKTSTCRGCSLCAELRDDDDDGGRSIQSGRSSKLDDMLETFERNAVPKRVWNGKLPSKTCGGYDPKLLKGCNVLNKIEERLFEAGIDVRGHYHKLGRDRPLL